MRWKPHTDAYAKNEEAMIDWEGNVKPPREREVRIVLDDIPEDEAMTSSLWVSPSEGAHIDGLMSNDPETEETITDEVDTFAEALSRKGEEGDFKMSTGSTYAPHSTFLTVTGDDCWSDDQSEESEESEKDQWDDMEDVIDSTMASATARFASRVNPEHLSKIWRISHEDAERTLDNTTNLLQRTTNPELSRKYGTNDRMLRYKRIRDYFYMDTFFATKEGGKSSMGHTCCQLFVTDKGFVYVVPMKRKGEVLLAMKQFAKEIGAPDAFVADMSGEQMSKEAKAFCSEIGCTLRALEEGTPWANKAEF
jgi:hypothetical protein